MLRFTTLALLGLFISLSCARFIDIESCLHKTEDKPKLTLPWGTWEGEKYGDEVSHPSSSEFGLSPTD